jgi:polygalacturonase
VSLFRREFLKMAAGGAAGTAAGSILTPGAHAQAAAVAGGGTNSVLDVARFGAKGDGTAIDSPAINRAIEAASASGGGTVRFGPGTYASYSIRLKSNVALYLDQGATIVAADTPEGGAPNGSGYDAAEFKTASDAYQDYGHNHWHNSLIWGDGLENIAILGPGLIWGKGLTRSDKPSQVRAPVTRQSR